VTLKPAELKVHEARAKYTSVSSEEMEEKADEKLLREATGQDE
jgi:hypothetical protein